MHAARRRSGILSFRSLLVLILAAAAAYLSFAPSFEALPLPVVLDILQNPTIGIGALAALQILALLIGIDVFGNGFFLAAAWPSGTRHARVVRGAGIAAALCLSAGISGSGRRRRTVHGGFHPSALRRNA